jgi:hypothetical protein
MKLHSSVSELQAASNVKRVFWIGAVSFESRCVGSISSLLDQKVEICGAAAFDYSTNLYPKDQGEESRSLNRKDFQRLLGTTIEFHQTYPYRYAELLGQLSNIVDSNYDLVVDITCLTKIHTVALAYWLLTRPEASSVTLAYSQPEYYGNPSKNIWGKGKWTTNLLLRLDLDSTETYSSTVALAILGHEGDRLRLALNETEATEALIIKSLPIEERMDVRLTTVTDIQNAWLFVEIEKGLRQGFNLKRINLKDLNSLHACVASLCESAKNRNARVTLCPFGPKLFVFLSAFFCLSLYPQGSWLSYPVPLSYDAQYSSGYKRTLWCTLKKTGRNSENQDSS